MRAGTVKILWGVVLVLGVSAGLHAQDMVPFRVPDSDYSILMPGTPKYESQDVPLQGGAKAQMNEWYVEMDDHNVSYMLMYNDYPPNYANGAPADMLIRFRDGATADKTLLSDQVISLNGVPGRAFTTKDKDGWLYDVHHFFVNKRLYQLIIVTAPGHTAIYRDEFMDSFKVGSSAAPPAAPSVRSDPLPDYKAELAAFTEKTSAWRALNPKPPLSEDVEKKRLLAEDDFANKNMAAAIEDYEAGVKLDPTWVQGWYNVAQLYAAQNDFEQAVFSMKHYLILLPDAPDAAEAKNDVLLWEAKAERAAGK